MGKIKEHACTEHKNSTGSNLILRYEEEVAELRKQLEEATKPSE